MADIMQAVANLTGVGAASYVAGAASRPADSAVAAGSGALAAEPLVAVYLADAERIPIDRVASALAGIQLAAGVASAADSGLANVAGLLDQALVVEAAAAGANGPEEVAPLQQAIDDILLGIDAVAGRTRFGPTGLLDGTVPSLTFDLGGGEPARRAELALLDARAARLGTASGGAPLATIGTGGANALAAGPELTATVVRGAQQEVAAARGAAEDLVSTVLEPSLELSEAELSQVTLGDQAGPDRDFWRDAFAQALGQGVMGSSLQAVYKNMLPRDRWVRMIAGE